MQGFGRIAAIMVDALAGWIGQLVVGAVGACLLIAVRHALRR